MTGIFLLIISALFSYLIVSPSYFPSLGISIIFIITATLVFLYKRHRQRLDVTLYVFTMLFSAFITLRANGFLTFLNVVAVFYTGSFLALSDKTRGNLNIFQIITLPLRIFVTFAQTENRFPVRLANLISKKQQEPKKIKDAVIAVIVTFVTLVIILPLLSSANPLFKSWVDNVVPLFNLGEFLKRFFGDDIFFHFLRVIFFLFSLFFLPRILSYVQEKQDDIEEHHIQLALLLPKIIIGGVLVVFFISQIQLYLATPETLKMLGLTNSQYAREVFGQLSVVAMVILGIIYTDVNKSRFSRFLTEVLLIEGVFLTLMAFKSVIDYSSAFGFTHKRLYGFTGVFWITGVFAMFLNSYGKKMHYGTLLKNLFLYSTVILLAVNVVNFDFLICNTLKSRTGEGVDYAYLITTLSTDAGCYDKLLVPVDKKFTINSRNDFRWGAWSYLIWKIDGLNIKYGGNNERFNWQTFNYSEYMEYQKIKNINLKKYKDILEFPVSVPALPVIPIPVKPVNSR